MKVNRIISKEIDLKITEITLLSADEWVNNHEYIPKAKYGHETWWLRDPDPDDTRKVMYVLLDQSVKSGIVSDRHGVRPVLRISNLKKYRLVPGSKFEIADYKWTVISDALAISDHTISVDLCFRKYANLQSSNVYAKSDIKKEIDDFIVSILNLELSNTKSQHIAKSRGLSK